MHLPISQRVSSSCSCGITAVEDSVLMVVCIGEGVSTGGGGGWAGGRFDQISLLSLLRLARTQTRHGWR